MEVAHSISQTCESNKWHPEVAEQTHKHRKRSYKTEPVQFELHLDFAKVKRGPVILKQLLDNAIMLRLLLRLWIRRYCFHFSFMSGSIVTTEVMLALWVQVLERC